MQMQALRRACVSNAHVKKRNGCANCGVYLLKVLIRSDLPADFRGVKDDPYRLFRRTKMRQL
jgi:hypothetical protein